MYDVNASCYELTGNGADGAYELIGRALSVDEICSRLRKVLEGGFGLTNSDGPFRLCLNIGPAGSGDDLPL